MLSRLVWTNSAWSDYVYWQGQDKKTLKRINKLIADRSEIINVFLDPDINQFQFQEFVIKYLQKDEEGKFRPFWSTIKYIFLTE